MPLLTIGEQAQLRADVRGARVLVKGHLKGSIVASERIELAPSAAVEGSLSANRVVLADGTNSTAGSIWISGRLPPASPTSRQLREADS